MACNWSVYLTLIASHSLLNLFLMRIALAAIIVICGANLLIELLDSSMMEVINERNETIQRQIDQMWQSGNCTQYRVNPLATPPNLLQYRQAGNETNPAPNSTQFSSCVRSNPKCVRQSNPTKIGSLVTLKSSRLKALVSSISTAIILHQSMKIAWQSMMVVGSLIQPNHDWTPYVMSSVLLVRVYSKRITSGLFVSSQDNWVTKKYSLMKSSPMVMSSHDKN